MGNFLFFLRSLIQPIEWESQKRFQPQQYILVGMKFFFFRFSFFYDFSRGRASRTQSTSCWTTYTPFLSLVPSRKGNHNRGDVQHSPGPALWWLSFLPWLVGYIMLLPFELRRHFFLLLFFSRRRRPDEVPLPSPINQRRKGKKKIPPSL